MGEPKGLGGGVIRDGLCAELRANWPSADPWLDVLIHQSWRLPLLDIRRNAAVLPAEKRRSVAGVLADHGRSVGLFLGAGFHLIVAGLCLRDNPKGHSHV